MAIDEPDWLIVTVSQRVPVTWRRCGELSGTIGPPGAVELYVKTALEDLEAVLGIVMNMHRRTGAVRTEPAVCLEDFAIGVLAVAHDVPNHVLARAEVDVPVRRAVVYRL
jgi:hypothetical protein